MQAGNSTVSVIIPVFNGERYVSEAIESVLAQTVPTHEILAVDDSSEDGSVEVVRRYPRVEALQITHSGIGGARNRGAQKASGHFLAFLDQDDIWLPDKLKLQMDAFARNPCLDMVLGHVRQFLSPDVADELRGKVHFQDQPVPGYLAGTLLVKRTAFFRAGLFRTQWKVGEFIDWYLLAKERGLRSEIVKEVVLRRRIHGENIGFRAKELRLDYVRIVKESLDRRRRAERADRKQAP